MVPLFPLSQLPARASGSASGAVFGRVVFGFHEPPGRKASGAKQAVDTSGTDVVVVVVGNSDEMMQSAMG